MRASTLPAGGGIAASSDGLALGRAAARAGSGSGERRSAKRRPRGRAAHRRSACTPSSGSPARTGRRAARLRCLPAGVRSDRADTSSGARPAAGAQRSNVRGLTKNTDHDRRGSRRLNTASSTRSASRSWGRFVCRRRIESSCLNTTISSSFEPDERKHSAINANRRQTTRYTSNTRDLQQTGHRPYPRLPGQHAGRLTEFSNPTGSTTPATRPWPSGRFKPTICTPA
jgi:hypothetical protein